MQLFAWPSERGELPWAKCARTQKAWQPCPNERLFVWKNVCKGQPVGRHSLFFIPIKSIMKKKICCDGLAWLLPGAFCEYRFSFVAWWVTLSLKGSYMRIVNSLCLSVIGFCELMGIRSTKRDGDAGVWGRIRDPNKRSFLNQDKWVIMFWS